MRSVMGELAKHDGGSPIAERKRSPLAGFPDGWREKVKFFYAAYSDFFKAPVGLAAMLRYWIKEYGLTLDEADVIFRRMLRPDEVAKIQHGGQAMAALGRMVDDAVATRKRREKQVADIRRQNAELGQRFPPERRGLHVPE